MEGLLYQMQQHFILYVDTVDISGRQYISVEVEQAFAAFPSFSSYKVEGNKQVKKLKKGIPVEDEKIIFHVGGAE